MSSDKEELQRDFAKDEQEEDRIIWTQDTVVLKENTVIQEKTSKAAQKANRLA